MIDLSSLFGGMPSQGASSEPSLQDQWSTMLKRPDVQAGLLNFGIELMKPRWTAGSALPDALAAGARGVAGVQEEQFNREQREQQSAEALAEREADRANRTQIAKISADSRAEVAGLRNAAMLEGIRTRHELANTGFNPQENSRFNTLVRQYVELRKNDLTKLGQPVDEAKVLQEAAAQARAIVLGERVGTGGGQGAGAGDFTSANPAAGGGPVGSPRPGAASNSTSANPSNTQNAPPPSSSPKPSTEAVINRLKELGRWNGRPSDAQLQYLRSIVSDPQALNAYARPGPAAPTEVPDIGTMQGFPQ